MGKLLGIRLCGSHESRPGRVYQPFAVLDKEFAMEITENSKTLKFDANGLIPAIVQDHYTKEVLTLAYMNAETRL